MRETFRPEEPRVVYCILNKARKGIGLLKGLIEWMLIDLERNLGFDMRGGLRLYLGKLDVNGFKGLRV